MARVPVDYDPFAEESRIPVDYDPFAEKPEAGVVSSLGRGLVEGLSTGIPEMVGSSGEFIGAKTGIEPLESGGRALKEWSGRKSEEWFGEQPERSGVAQIVYEGSKMLAPSIIPGGAMVSGARTVLGVGRLARAAKLATAAGDLVKATELTAKATSAASKAMNLGSAANAVVLFGTSQAQHTIDSAEQTAKQLEADGDIDGARKAREAAKGYAPYLTGAIEAAGEYFGTKYLGKLFGLSEAEVVGRGAKELGKQFAKTLGVEIGTEVGQAGGQSAVEKTSGIRPDADPLQEAFDVVGPTAFMTLLTGGLAHAVNRKTEKPVEPINKAAVLGKVSSVQMDPGQLAEIKTRLATHGITSEEIDAAYESGETSRFEQDSLRYRQEQFTKLNQAKTADEAIAAFQGAISPAENVLRNSEMDRLVGEYSPEAPVSFVDRLFSEWGQDGIDLQFGEDTRHLRRLALPAPEGVTYGEGFEMRPQEGGKAIIRRAGEEPQGDYVAGVEQDPKVIYSRPFKSKNGAIASLNQRLKSGSLKGNYDVVPAEGGMWRIESMAAGQVGEAGVAPQTGPAQTTDASDVEFTAADQREGLTQLARKSGSFQKFYDSLKTQPIIGAYKVDAEQASFLEAIGADGTPDSVRDSLKRLYMGDGLKSKKEVVARKKQAEADVFMDAITREVERTTADLPSVGTVTAPETRPAKSLEAGPPSQQVLPQGEEGATEPTSQEAIKAQPSQPGESAPATPPQFTIEPLGDKSIISLGDIPTLRAKLKAAGFAPTGIPNTKRGGLVFAKKHEAEVRAALEPSVSKPAENETQADLSSKGETQKEVAVSSVRKTKSLVRIRPSGPLGNEYTVTFADGRTVFDVRGLNRDEAIADARAMREGEDRSGARAKKIGESPWKAPQAEYISTFTGSGPLRAGLVADHRAAVEQALSEGKPVPAEVLSDYPDLQKETPNAQTDKADTVAPVAQDKSGDDAGGLTPETEKRAVELETQPDKHGDTVNAKVSRLVAALQEDGHTTTMSGDFYGDRLIYVDLGEESAGKVDEGKLPAGWVLTYKHLPLTNEAVLGTPIPENQAEVSNTVKSVDARTRIARAGKEAVSPQDISAILKSFLEQQSGKNTQAAQSDNAELTRDQNAGLLAQEAKKYESAKDFIAGLEKTNYGDLVKDVPIGKIDRDDFFNGELSKAQKEIEGGKYTRSSGDPVRLFYSVLGGNYSMVDGYHRLAIALKDGKDTITASVEFSLSPEVKAHQQLSDIWETSRAEREPTGPEIKQASSKKDETKQEDAQLVGPPPDQESSNLTTTTREAELENARAMLAKDPENALKLALVQQAKERLEAAGKSADHTEDKIDMVPGKLGDIGQEKRENPGIKTDLAFHDETMRRIQSGDATMAEYKSGFKRVIGSKEELTAEFSKMTKDKLIDRIGGYYRSKSDKKDALVSSAYNDMLTDFWVQTGMFSYGMDGIEPAIAKAVNEVTEADLKTFSERVAAKRKERKAMAAQMVEAVKDPKTLEDFHTYIRAKKAEGKTFTEARMTLTPEQRATFDELTAEKSRKERGSRKEEARTRVHAAGATTGAEIIATKHTRDGYDLFVVQAEERVDREVYNEWNAAAKKMGGWYSKFRGNGAIPGFQFKTREAAEAFQKYVSKGDTEAVKEQAQARRDAYADDRSQTAVERLTEMADKLEESADESLGRDRKANTSRRAGMAARAEANANGDKAMAKTMRNIARAIQDGTAKFLDRVRQKAQVAELASIVGVANYTKLRAQYPDYGTFENHRHDRPTIETADHVEFPSYTAYRSNLAKLGRQLLEQDGTKLIGKRLMTVADDVTDAYLAFAKENLHLVSGFSGKDGSRATFPSKVIAEAAINRSGYRGKAIVLPFKRGQNLIILSPSEAQSRGLWEGDDDKRITLSQDFGAEIVEKAGKNIDVPWHFETTRDRLKRLAGMGIETPAELRAAAREYIGLREAPKAADKVKELERAMIGRKNDGMDFFPTPEATADEMVQAAGIEPGMKVLEPSAGWGHIAERIRAAGVEPDVVEMSSDRQELLEAKGFNVVGRDFMDTEGQYDRIIMNPPFSDRRDAEHVQHAYSLLNPGGRLVAIMGEGVFFGKDKKAQAFREWMEAVGGTDEKLEQGTFLDPSLPVNTGVNSRMVVIEKEADKGVALYSKGKASGTTTAQVETELRSFLKRGYDKLTASGKLRVVQGVAELPGGGGATIYSKDGGVRLMGQAVSREKTLSEITDRVSGTKAFRAWLEDQHEDTAEVLEDREVLESEVEYFIEQEHGLSISDEGLVDFYGLTSAVREIIGDLPVVVYHHTSDAILKKIKKEGLVAGLKDVNRNGLPALGVYVTNETSGPAVDGYLRRAAQKHKGNETTLSIVARLKDLAQDMDDADLTSGRTQYVLREVTPGQILEVKGPDDVILYSKDGSIAGTYDPKTGQITLVADNIKAGDAEYVMLHEGLHKLMREDAIFAKQHDAILDQFEKLKATDYRVQDAFRRVPSDTAANLVREEALAYYLQGKANHETSLFKKIMANIRMWLMRMGIPMKNLTTDDLVALVTQGVRRMANQGEADERAVGDMAPVLQSKAAAPSVVDDIMAVAYSTATPEQVKRSKEKGPIFPGGFDIPEEGKATKLWDYLVFKAQDKFNPLKKVQELAKKSRGLSELPEAEDAYLAELRYHGQAGARIEDFHDEHVEPMIEAIHKAGLTLEDVGRYLWARHAPEANAQLAKINPEMENNTALSGMSNEEAEAVLAGYGAKRAELDAIGKRVDAITKMRRDLLVESGLEKAETVAVWEKAYQHYVPLHREGKGGNLPSQGRGFDTRGTEKRRTGSTKDAVNILAHVVAQYEKTAIKAEKAKVGRALLEFIKNNPDQRLWEVDKVTFKPTFDKDGLVQYREDKGFILADNVLVVKVDGEDHRITFNQENEQAKRIVGAMKNLGAEQNGILVGALSTINRWLAVVNTSANPEFIISNLLRDLQTAGYNLNATEAKNLKISILKDVGKAWGGIRKAQGKDYSTEWAQHFREFRQAGAKTGWLEFYRDIEHREAKLQKMMEAMGDGSSAKIIRGLKSVEQFIEHENTAVENAIRLSTFVHARKAGISVARAAALAKELTVNFNRKGDAGQLLNALYLFYNASIQGTVRMFQAAKNKKVQKLMAGTVVAAAMLDMANRAMGGDDDDDEPFYDKIPDHTKERNLIIMRPGGDYFKIPLPWGYNVLHVFGQEAGKALDDNHKGYKPGKSAMRIVGSMLSSFNPIGSEASLTQMLSPTITDPIVQWAENKDWAGRPLRPENSFNQNQPESQKYWNSVREPSKWVAEKLNELTGGDEVRPGLVDISPELFDMAFDTMTGGIGRFMGDMVTTPLKLVKGEEVESYTVPLARKIYGSQSNSENKAEFYENLDSVKLVKQQLKHYEGDTEKIKEIREEHGAEIKMIGMAKLHEKTISKLKDTRRKIERSGLPDDEKKARIKKIDDQIIQAMKRFNKAYKSRVL